jgi:hypothetical protein
MRLELPLANYEGSQACTEYVDLRAEEGESSYIPSNLTPALTTYAAELAKYPYLDTGYDEPGPVLSDLLLPFGVFVDKHPLKDAVQLVASYGQGVGNVLALPSQYILRYFGISVLNGVENGFVTTVLHNNNLLYEHAQTYLGDNILLNNTILPEDRRTSGGAKLLVQTPARLVLIKSTKLSNLQGWNLSASEMTLFWQFSNRGC